MKPIIGALIALAAVASAGCGQVAVFGHTVGESKSASRPEAGSTSNLGVVVEGQKVRGVSIVIAEPATEKLAADAKFNIDTLLAAIKSELKAREAFDDADPQVTAIAEITIDDYVLRPTSNAILFGQIISTGTLTGSLRVRDAQGVELTNRRIEAKAQVSVAAKGESVNALAPLYRQFAVLTGNTLTGKIVKPADSDNWRPR